LVFAGRRLSHRCVVAFEDAGFTFKDSLAWLRESAPHRAQRVSVVFERRGDEVSAKKWEGWRIGNLRPTFEPILWFVKPYTIGKTIADNVLAHEIGAFNERAFTSYERTPDNILRSGFAKGEGGLHIAQKPVKLLRALIELTTVPGQVVLDPFCGSGSTLVAAKDANRRYVGFEIDEGSVRTARKRLAPNMFENQAEEKRAEFNRVYCTTFCNQGHRLGDGKPVGHECYVLPPLALMAERDGDYNKAIRILSETRSSRRVHRGVKS